MTYSYGFYFGRPLWLAGIILLVPVIWLAWRSMSALGRGRQVFATVLRCLVILILVMLLARPMLTRKNPHLTLVAVIDRSQSIPLDRYRASMGYLSRALSDRDPADRLAVVDVAELASISKLPSTDMDIPERNTTLDGQQSNLAAGIEMAMAIAPPDTAARILLISEGNETAGDLKGAARTAAANKIPIDVLPLRYQYDREVLFKRLAAPPRARSGQTVSLRFILNSTAEAAGKLMLNLNDKPVDLAPDSADVTVPISLQPGTNFQTVSIPVGSRGMHEFEAVFMPDSPDQDRIIQNNRASAMTYVAGPGHILVVDADGSAGKTIENALKSSDMVVEYCSVGEFPDDLARLMDTDAVVLADTDCAGFTYQQQEMLCRYVSDLGGGLVMVGGPHAFGAGGWIGSPVADILPVDLDPPQKKQLPKGALVLIMHACEMPQGNLWGKRVAIAAVKTLSRLDLVGILAYNWQGGSDWVYPLSQADDKQDVIRAINMMQMGDMPSLHAHLQEAYDKLTACNASQKHVIVISDGDPQEPSTKLLGQCQQARISVSGVGVFPHSPADTQSLMRVARATGGRFYNVSDPRKLPQIFIKEAQVIKRALIFEETFTPQITYSLSEITKGLPAVLPALDGYVVTGPKGGLNQIILSSHEADPVMAICQSGLGRCAAFTSSVDSRWASNWLGWPGFTRFWEQTVRWAGKPAQSPDCEVFADVQGRRVTVNVEAVDAEGKFVQFANVDGQVIAPDISSQPLELTQVGPGQYQGRFQAGSSGSYIINLRHRRLGEDAKTQATQSTVTIPFAPEFQDMSDNAPLLAEISEISGGRILSYDPNQADLFDYAGLEFPKTHLPLLRPLIYLWLALFLLDVAARRVVLDVRAIARRLVLTVRRWRGELKPDATLERLQATREKLRRQLGARAAEAAASKRYEAAEAYEGELPTAPAATGKEQTATSKPKEPARKKTTVQDSSHIQRLLDAKRKAADHQGEDENEKE